MQITCPTCEARFAVADRLLGPSGRKLRCASCGAVWHQNLIKEEAPPEAAEADAWEAPEREATPRFTAASSRDSEDTPGFMSDTATAARKSVPVDDDFESSAEKLAASVLDKEFPLEQSADPLAADPLVRRTAAAVRDRLSIPLDSGDDASDKEDLDLRIGDDGSDSLPEGFKLPLQREGKAGKGWLKKGLIALGVLLVGVPPVVGVTMRDTIVARWPKAIPLYKVLHLGLRTLGTGLQFKTTTPERAMLGSVEILIVHGTIDNVSAELRPVPKLKLSLLDKNGHLIQETVSRPPKEVLGPGESLTYRMQIEHPSAEAAKINVTFTEGEAAP
ncbi:MAG: zinc-ribbon domain-containing protein [Alphaproteobacteria bacterium]|nr:zinc-ribbon domain-containing protein [Alphaproteobacteria bacterium]